MALLEGTRAARFELVTAAHHFALAALPLRHPQSRDALAAFVDVMRTCRLPSPDRETVLIRLLAVLEPHTGGRLPSMVDRYFSLRHELPDAAARFQRCVEDVIRYRGIGNRCVQQAIAIIHDRYAAPDLRQASVAELGGVAPPALCAAFKAQTGTTFVEYLRDVRLNHAAAMLVESARSVKEVWAAVGYNDAANFAHDFKHRFGVPPKEYRARGIRPGASDPARAFADASSAESANGREILVVDDDPDSRDMLGARLGREGYAVRFAASGHEVLTLGVAWSADVVVLDVHMPHMDGFACLRALRAQQPGLRPPVILFTADWDLEDREDDAHALGATIVPKMCDAAEIERVVASMCAMVPRRVRRPTAVA